MPWSPGDATKHNLKATGAKGRQWSAVADNVLAKTGDDVQAIKVANVAIKRTKTPRGHRSEVKKGMVKGRARG